MHAALVGLLLVAADVPEIPLLGRPADLPFSGASAGFAVAGPEHRAPFVVTASVSPADVEELDPLTFAVTVRAAGKVYHPPQRIDLRQLPAFARRFHIEDITDGKEAQTESSCWRWAYRLRPRAAGIDEVPGLPFVFYNPDLLPAEKGFQVIWTDPIALRVRSAERLALPVPVIDEALIVTSGSRVLLARHPWAGPGAGLLTITLAGPPVACFVWYLAWRRRNPDAARLLHERRSWAARRALRRLDAARRQQGRACADAVVGAVGEYLHARFDFPVAEPTPEEVAAWVAARGVDCKQAEQGRRLLEACAAERFQPTPGAAADLPGQAHDWIIALEEPPCPPSS
jgi:hypothetical protein